VTAASVTTITTVTTTAIIATSAPSRCATTLAGAGATLAARLFLLLGSCCGRFLGLRRCCHFRGASSSLTPGIKRTCVFSRWVAAAGCLNDIGAGSDALGLGAFALARWGGLLVGGSSGLGGSGLNRSLLRAFGCFGFGRFLFFDCHEGGGLRGYGHIGVLQPANIWSRP